MNHGRFVVPKRKPQIKAYARVGRIIPIPCVLPFVKIPPKKAVGKKGWRIRPNKSKRLVFNGKEVYVDSIRLRTFRYRGTVCRGCGIKATHFAVENRNGDDTHHLNLYGIDDTGSEILFTKDHIHPKAHGGKDILDNMQTMCIVCNVKKGDTIIGGGVSHG